MGSLAESLRQEGATVIAVSNRPLNDGIDPPPVMDELVVKVRDRQTRVVATREDQPSRHSGGWEGRAIPRARCQRSRTFTPRAADRRPRSFAVWS